MLAIQQNSIILIAIFFAGLLLGPLLYRFFAGRQSRYEEVRLRRSLAEAKSSFDKEQAKLMASLQAQQEKNEKLRLALQESDETAQLLSAEKVPTYQKEIDDRNRRIAGLEERLAHARADLADCGDQEQTLNRQIDGLVAGLEQRQSQVDELVAKFADLPNLGARIEQKDREIAKLQADRDHLRSRIEHMQLKLAEREKQVTELQAADKARDYDRQIKDRDDRLTHLTAQFAELRDKLPALNDALRERDASIEDLLEELSRERKKIYSLEQAIADSRAVEKGTVQVQRSGNNIISLRQHRDAPTNPESTDRGKDAEEQVALLQAELDEWKGKYQAAKANKDHIKSAQGVIRRNTSDSKNNVEELQEINGIGPVLALSLGELGISKISHLARLAQDDLERIAQLNHTLATRIERNGWIEQAQRIQQSRAGDE